ncbi:MAG: hypothetical protein ACYSUI_18495 [Planctomycetota bacterium]
MLRLLRRMGSLALLAGAGPLVTVGTCNRSETGGNFVLNSTNDHLVADVLDILFDEDDDDD